MVKRLILQTLVLSLVISGASFLSACSIGKGRTSADLPNTNKDGLGGDQGREDAPGPKPTAFPSATPSPTPSFGEAGELGANQVLVTLLATNDLHGAMESTITREGKKVGGLDQWGGYVKAVKQGLAERYQNRAGVMVLDAGDQFQGTLLSNYDEGETLFKLLDQVGYDAVIPGNHDYDFGPLGWLVDQSVDGDPRGALKKLTRLVSFPLVSANTYLKSSLRDVITNREVAVNGQFCRPLESGVLLNWAQAARPDFLQKYLIKHLPNGVRVAVIGIDNPSTATTTTPANVSDLCFRDEVQTYLEVRRELEGQADVFVLLMHQGNASNEFRGSDILERILDAEGSSAVHAVLAGHTHFVNNVKIQGVPLIQDGANGEKFGRIDLVYDLSQKQVVQDKTRVYAGAPIYHDECASGIRDFCAKKVSPEPETTVTDLLLEGKTVVRERALTALIEGARSAVAPLANRVLGTVSVEIRTHRTEESVLANWLTDGLRQLTVGPNGLPEVSMLNTGGIRAPIAAGTVSYENLFRVLPFNNRAVVLNPVPVARVLSVLTKSAKTCGGYGAMMQSGLKIVYERNCRSQNGKEVSIDENARLLSVETLAGEVWVENGRQVVPANRNVRVVTLDFLAAGGSAFSELAGLPVEPALDGSLDRGIARELLADYFDHQNQAAPLVIPVQTDGRFKRQVQP